MEFPRTAQSHGVSVSIGQGDQLPLQSIDGTTVPHAMFAKHSNCFAEPDATCEGVRLHKTTRSGRFGIYHRGASREQLSEEWRHACVCCNRNGSGSECTEGKLRSVTHIFGHCGARQSLVACADPDAWMMYSRTIGRTCGYNETMAKHQ